jgi:hypothetical protein
MTSFNGHFSTLSINPNVKFPGVQFGDQPCIQPLGGMTFNKGDQTMLGRVKKRGLGKSWHLLILKQQQKTGLT